ncbi:MAG: Calx-beta domain-containing protein, partial [Candidatus Binatia bacterium]
NYPVLSAAINLGAASDLTGSLNSTANTTFDVDIYASPTCDGSGFGEGRTLLGSTSVSSDSGGDVNFDITSITLPLGQFITATATDPAGVTSEFSGCMQVTGGAPGVIQFSSPTYSVGESGGQVTITAIRVGGGDGPIGVNYSTSNGTAIGSTSCDGTADFINSSGTINFADGDTVDKTFDVPICEDTVVEGDQNFAVILSSGPFATVTIVDNDVIPTALTVTSLADTDDGSCTADPDGCTLREAINAANALPDANEISFAPTVTGSITLTGSLQSILTPMTITGPGANVLTISGNDVTQIFTIANDQVVNISGLTLAHGNGPLGGAILDMGSLTISNCMFANNSSIPSGGGGALYVAGGANNPTFIQDSTFSNNSSGEGGAIEVQSSPAIITRTTFDHNTASGSGGAIKGLAATITVADSTISGNSAHDGGGIYLVAGTYTLVNDTISNNVATTSGGGELNDVSAAVN